MRLDLLLAISLFSIVACSSSSGGGGGGDTGPAKPPAAKESTKKLTTSLSAVQEVLTSKTKRPLMNKISLLSLNKASDPQDKSGGPTVEKVTNNLNKMLDPAKCKFNVPIDENPNPTQPPPTQGGQPTLNADINDMLVEITGPQCPMEAKIVVKAKKSEQVIDADFDMMIVAKSDEMKKELGLSSAKINGKIGMVMAQTGQTHSIKGRLAFTGSGESLNDGPFSFVHNVTPDIVINMPAEGQNPGNGGMDLSNMFTVKMSENQVIDFVETKTSLASEVTMSGLNVTGKYLINGAEVTAQEYEEYVSQISYPGMMNPGQGGGGNGPGYGEEAMMCTMRIYRASEVSLLDLQKSLQGETMINIQPIGMLGSCGQSQNQSTIVDGKTLKYGLTYDMEKITASVTRGNLTGKQYAQKDDFTKVATQVDDVTWAVECFPVQQCH